MLELRWPYANPHVFNPNIATGVVGANGSPSFGFYYGNVMPANTSTPVALNFSTWAIDNPINPGDVPIFTYSVPFMYGKFDTHESVSGHIGGEWGFNTNQWYRYVCRTWLPADGTPNLSYLGGWIKDLSAGTWQHIGTARVPFTAAGFPGPLPGFQENLGSTTPWRTEYRNCYYHSVTNHAVSNQWYSANQFTAGANSGWLVNAGVISNGTVAFLECCPSNNPVGYVGTPFNSDIPLLLTNQPAQPVFDAIIVTNASAAVSSGQLLVSWQVPPVSSPQLGYTIEVFTNSSYTGSPAVAFSRNEPEARQQLLDITGVATPYVRLTVTDIFYNTNAPILMTPGGVALVAATNISGTVTGLRYAYYESTTNFLTMPSFASRVPVRAGAVNGPDLTPRLKRSRYAFNFTGYLSVPADGLYAFTLTSFDGGILYLDGAQVINNDGVHSVSSRSGWAGLRAGLHAINIQYFMDEQINSYDDVFALAYEGPGLTNASIPASAYYRLPSAGEPLVTLVSPSNGASLSSDNLMPAASVVTNGNAINSVQFWSANATYNFDNYLGQDINQPYSVNLPFWASAANLIRARVVYNGTNTLDSIQTLSSTTDMDVSPWTFTPLNQHVCLPGVSSQGGTLTIVGDSMNLLTRQVTGDCTLIGHLAGLPGGSAPDASGAPETEAGIILRGNLNAVVGLPLGNSSTRFAAVFGKAGGTYFQDDTMVNGGGAYASGNLGGGNKWFKLVRAGDTFTSYISVDGENWTVVNTNTLSGIGTTIYAGMFSYTLQSRNPNLSWATLDNVSLLGNVVGPLDVEISPASSAVYTGQSASFASTVVGNPPFTRQWRVNGLAIPGATNATLALTNLLPGNSGLYSLLVSNSSGTATSASSLLTVTSPSLGSTDYSAQVFSNAPYAYWRMNEASGTVALDNSGHGRNGTYANVTLARAGPQPPNFNGLEATNTAVLFNGTNSGIRCGTAASLSGTTDFTVMAWVNTLSSSKGVVIQQRNGGYDGEYVFSVNGTVTFFVYSDAGGYQFDFGTSQSVNDGQWHHLVGVRSGANGYIYIDGQLAASASGSVVSSLNSSLSTCIGYDQRDATSYFNGRLDEVAVFDKALSPGTIQSLYQAGAVPPPPLTTLTAPTNGTGFVIPATVTLSATFNTNGHTVSTMQFYNGTTLLGQDATPPYSLEWSNVSAGTYTVLAQATYDGTNVAASAPAIINVFPPLTITAQPQSQTNLAGTTATFSVGASGASPFVYQWQFNNADILSATSAILSLANCRVADSGNYRVIITASDALHTSATSTVATLLVYPPPVYPVTVLSNGPVAYWRMNETSGYTAFDSSTNSNNATFSNVALGQDGPQPSAFSGLEPVNLAGQYDGASSYIACPAGASLNGATDFSVMAWVKTTTAAGGVVIQQRDSGGTGYNGQYQLSLNAAGTARFYVYNNGIYQFNFSTTLAVNDGSWHHLAGVRSGVNGYIYIDGVQAGSASGTYENLSSTIRTYIGYDQRDGNSYFNGIIDEAAIFNKALSATTIQNLYRSATNASPVVYALTYTAGSNGTISGTASQTVAYGASGTAVTAVPDANYHFVDWSDASTANPRTDTNVTNNIAVTANFASNTPRVVTNAVWSSTELAYQADASATDLLHGITPTTTGWNISNDAHPNEVNDGIHGNTYNVPTTDKVQGGWTTVGATAEYNLGLGAGGNGWDITNIHSIAAWSGVGFGNQAWTFQVKLKGAGSYTTLATVNYQPLGGTNAGATKVVLSEDTGVLASGVEYIKVTANQVNGGANAGAFVWRELDVFGVLSGSDATPPTVTTLSPANNVTNVSPGVSLRATFSENIAIGSGNITIKNLDTLSQTVIPVGDAQISVSGAVLTIDPSVNLEPNTRYAIQIDAGAITDGSGNPFTGILDDTTWRFTTGSVVVRKVFLLGGQSNSVGQAPSSGLPTSPVNLQQPQSDVLFYFDGSPLTTLRPGSGGNPPPTGLHFGPEVTFGRAVADASPTVAYAIIKHGENGTALYNDWAPGTGASYTAFRNTVAAGLAALQASGDTVEIVGMLWHQGESDAIEGQQANYAANLTAFIADIRSRYGANLPFFIGEIRRSNGPAFVTVADAQIDVAAADPYSRFVPASDLTFMDTYHFDAASQMTLGERFAAAYAALTSPTPIKIMSIGDSITAGYTDNPTWNERFKFGYRSGLYTRLSNAGYNFQFVGGSAEPWNGAFGDPTLGGTYTPLLDLRDFGQDGHRGYGGKTVSYLNSNILSWLAADNPDIILLKIGTNAKDTTGLNTLVNTIVTTKPNAHLIIAEIIPKYTYDQPTVDYNTYIRDTLVPAYQAQGKNVTLVDQYVNFLTNTNDLASINQSLFSNGINHPSNVGYDKMAQTWFDGIEALELLLINPSTLTVTSAHGTPVPSGVTSVSSNATVNAWISGSPEIVGSNQYVCTGWIGTGSLTNGSGTNTSFTMTNDTTITWIWETNLTSYTLIYLPGANGVISGTKTQTVDYGMSGSAVTAIPNGGYHFVDWSDAGTANPRTDPGVTNNITVTANFASNVPPVVATGAGPSPATATSAVLRGVLTTGEPAEAWICWGIRDGGTSSTGDWGNVVSVGSVMEGLAFSNLVTGLSTNTTYFYRCYAENAYGSDWSDTATTFSGRPSSAGGDMVLGWSYTNWTGDADADISSNYIYTAKHSFGNNRASAVVNGVTFTEGNATSGTGWSIGGTASYWDGDDDAAVTGNSELLAQEFVYSGNPRTVTLTGLTVGQAYEVSFYSSAWEPGDRTQTFSLTGGSSTNINQDAYGNNQGIRISCRYIATSTSQQFTITPVSASTFHFYALANREAVALATIANLAPTAISDSAATLNAALAAMGTNYDVTVYYGTTDGGTNATSWAASAAVGSWTNVASTNISYTVSGLTAGQTYYYTFMASNTAGRVWASPSWTFSTPAAAQSPTVTVNHSVPYVWLAARNAAWATNYEAAALADPDGDGFATWQEYWSGTDPQNSNSYLRIDSVIFDGTNIVLIWENAAVGVGLPPLAIQAKTNLLSGAWTYAGEKALTNGVNVWSNGAMQQLFYRLAVTNAP